MATGLKRADMAPDPYMEFEKRFTLAIESGIPEPNAMSVATLDEHGQPWVRTVLLKTYDERGFVFFTNYESRKARHIAHNPKVALSFPWFALGWEVKVTGEAKRVSFTESASYFATRPRGSQIGAWASPQSEPLTDRAELEARVAAESARHGERERQRWWHVTKQGFDAVGDDHAFGVLAGFLAG